MIAKAPINRYCAALGIFARTPMASARYAMASLLGWRRTYKLDFGGVELLVRSGSTDLKVVRSCLLGEFDEAFDLVSPEHDLIVDAGGYIGITAILFAMRFPDSLVVAIEPNPENFALARANCAPFKNIEVLNAALCPREGVVTLYDAGRGEWGFTIVDDGTPGRLRRRIVEIPAVTIDGLLERYGKNGVDLLKLDIEGAEHALLRDCPDWVERCGVIVAELHDRICPESTRTFQRATAGRSHGEMRGEKVISVRSDGVRSRA